MDPKFLTESGWKAISTKFKVKDNGLLRALWTYEKLSDDKFDERLKAIVQVAALAGSLRRAKEVAALPEVAKYLANVANEAEFQRREIMSAKTVTGSQHFAIGTCLLEEGKLTFVTDDFDPSKFVTEMRRSIQYFTGKKFAVRARGTDDGTAAEEDPDEDKDGPEDQDEE